MSRSRRRNPICANTCRGFDRGDKEWKRQANRRLRHENRVRLLAGRELLNLREIAHRWYASKGGKTWFDPEECPGSMRK